MFYAKVASLDISSNSNFLILPRQIGLLLLLQIERKKNSLARENTPQQARRILNKTFNQGGEKLDIFDKGSWLNQNFYQDKMAETTTKVLPEVDIDPKSNSDNDDDIYSDSSLPYIVVNSKLSEAALAKIARCHEVAPKCL